MLCGTSLFHVAHATMHLYPGRRYVDANLGAPALDHRNHQLDKSHVLLAHGCVRVPERFVVRCRHHIGQRPTRLGQRLHAHQHAPHIRMHDDRHFRAATHTHFVALNTLFGVISRPLIGAFAHRHTLHADTETRHVHHDEHVLKTMVLLADQIPHRPAPVAKGHYGRRAGMNPHFVFNRRTPCIVTRAKSAVLIDQKLRDDEQRNSLDAFRRGGRSRQHEVDDVFRHIVLAVGNEDLLAKELVTAIGLRLGTGAYCGKIRTGTRFSEIHRPRPFASDHFLKVRRFELVGTGKHQRINSAAGEQGAQRKRMICRFPHLGDRCRHQNRQALPAPLRFAAKRRPTALGKQFVGFLEAFGHRHLTVLKAGTFPVANTIKRRQNLLGKSGGFFQNSGYNVRRSLLAPRHLSNPIEFSQLVEHEQHIANRGAVLTHVTLLSVAKSPYSAAVSSGTSSNKSPTRP